MFVLPSPLKPCVIKKQNLPVGSYTLGPGQARNSNFLLSLCRENRSHREQGLGFSNYYS